MSGGGSQTTTTSSTVPQQFLNAYTSTVNRATQVANQPYQAYTGNLVAGFTPDQTQAQTEVEQQQGSYQPELNAAQSSINASTTPLWNETMQSGVSPTAGIAGYQNNFYGNAPGVNAQTIGQYESPYQSQVIGATEAQIANTDAIQDAQLAGNAASAGAFGGDRMGVEQGITAGQQALANNATLANLNQSNYAQALGEANTQQSTAIGANEAEQQIANSEFNTQQQNQLGANEANAWLNSQAGYAEGNLAQEGTNLGLTDSSALAASGLTQQQQNQAGLNTAYEQWEAQQAFPYQQTGWLANITEGIGSNVGGSSTTSTSSSNRGGRIARWGGGIVPTHGAMGRWGGQPMTRWGGGLVPAHYDDGGSILSDVPNVSMSYIPTSGSGGGGGGIGRGPPTAQAQPMQQSPLSNPATDIGAVGGLTSLYNNLGGPQLIGTNGIIAGPIGSWFGNGAASNAADAAAGVAGYDPAVDGVVNAAAGSSTGAAGAGFMGQVGDTIATGASDVASGLGSAASAVGSSLGGLGDAVVGAASTGLGWLGDLIAAILPFAEGGRVGEEPQHHARGGIVIPFPQDRARRASGGIAGNSGEMPYDMAPPVPVQANGTTGMPAIGYMSNTTPLGETGGAVTPTVQPASTGGSGLGNTLGSMAASGDFGLLPMMFRNGGGIVTRAFGGGIGSGMGGADPFSLRAPDLNASSDGANPFSLKAPSLSASATGVQLRRGGIVPNFDDGGAATGAATGPANDDPWSGAAGTPDADQAAAWNATPSDAAPSSQGTGIVASGPTYTPEKPNLWMPAVAGIASAVLGRHTNNARNIAEGVLAGLGTYNKEDQQYQEGQQKAVSLDQEAKRLANDAEFHKNQIGLEQNQLAETSRHNQATETTTAQNSANEASHNRAIEAIERGRLGIQAQAENSLDSWRKTQGETRVLVGTNPADGSPIYGGKYGGTFDEQGNPYTGPVAATANVAARVGATERGQTLQHQDRVAALNQRDQTTRATLDQRGETDVRSAADSIITNGKAPNYDEAVRQARLALGRPAPTAAPAQSQAPSAPPPWQRNWQTQPPGQ